MDLALNNLQRLICHKTQQTKLNQERKIILCHNLFGDKIIQNCLKIDITN